MEVDNKDNDVPVVSHRSSLTESSEETENIDNDALVAAGCFSEQLEESPREEDSKDNDIPFGSGCPSEKLYEN